MSNFPSLARSTVAALLPGSISFALEHAQKIRWLGRDWAFLPPASTLYIFELGIAYAIFSHIMEKADKSGNRSQLTFDKGLLLLGTSIVVTYLSPQVTSGTSSMQEIDIATALKCTMFVGTVHFITKLIRNRNKVTILLKEKIKDQPDTLNLKLKEEKKQRARQNFKAWKTLTARRLKKTIVPKENSNNTSLIDLLKSFTPINPSPSQINGPNSNENSKGKRRARKSEPTLSYGSRRKRGLTRRSHPDLSVFTSPINHDQADVLMKNAVLPSDTSSPSSSPSGQPMVSDSSPTAPTEQPINQPNFLETKMSARRINIQVESDDSNHETSDDEFKPDMRKRTPRLSVKKQGKFFMKDIDETQTQMVARKYQTKNQSASDSEDF